MKAETLANELDQRADAVERGARQLYPPYRDKGLAHAAKYRRAAENVREAIMLNRTVFLGLIEALEQDTPAA